MSRLDPLFALLVVATASSCGSEPAIEVAQAQAEHAPAVHEAAQAPTVVITQDGTQEAQRPPMTVDEIALSGLETPQDWAILMDRIEWARSEGLDQVPIGEAVARIGETFVGEPYTPGTLEVADPEALVVNLREFDCVTFVETSLALARVVQSVSPEVTDSEVLRGRYIEELTHLRYRHGVIDGYPSRLHYFSEWIGDNERRGTLQSVSHLMGGTEVVQPINFMSTHADAYRQLGEPGNLEVIRELEQQLTAVPLYPIRENRVGQFVDEIETGDIIAATSTVEGLDVAHTGIAVWKGGQLHLMHAPLVGSTVEISEAPLADRLLGIRGQDGIFVARPLRVP